MNRKILADLPTTLRRTGKVALPSVAFLPAIIVALRSAGILGDSFLVRASAATLRPAFSVASLLRPFGVASLAVGVGILVGLLWCGLLAYLLYRVARIVTAEDFEWYGFWSGMAIGFFPGALFGWRSWIRNYNSVSLLACITAWGIIGGTALGIYMGSYWSKTRFE
jgi:hypothetical protein